MARVLVVDDDPDNCLLFQAWLRGLGHEVLSAASAVEALEILSGHEGVEVAVVDIVMRPVTGLTLVQQWRDDPAYARMPVILLTARELDSDQDSAAALGAVLVKKPMRRAALVAAIESALEAHAAGRTARMPAISGGEDEPAVILLVEDNADDVFLLRHAFTRAGIAAQIVVALDGVEAVALLLGTDGDIAPRGEARPGSGTSSRPGLRPLIVLMDINMPRMGGLQALAQIHAHPQTCPVPVIMMTDSRHDEERAEREGRGLIRFVPKPLSPEDFLRAADALGVHWPRVNRQNAPLAATRDDPQPTSR
jgi:CheY-like chemotaxis protein